MRKSEKWQMALDAIKNGYITAGTGISLGLASVKTTILFGLITTGTVVSIPLVGAWALGGALLGGGVTYGSIKLRHHLVKKEYENLMNQGKSQNDGGHTIQ